MNFDHKAISKLSEPLYIRGGGPKRKKARSGGLKTTHLDKFEPHKMLMQAVSNYDQDACLVQCIANCVQDPGLCNPIDFKRVYKGTHNLTLEDFKEPYEENEAILVLTHAGYIRRNPDSEEDDSPLWVGEGFNYRHINLCPDEPIDLDANSFTSFGWIMTETTYKGEKKITDWKEAASLNHFVAFRYFKDTDKIYLIDNSRNQTTIHSCSPHSFREMLSSDDGRNRFCKLLAEPFGDNVMVA